MHSSINFFFIKLSKDLDKLFVNIVDMETRSVKRYHFKSQNLDDLKKLALVVTDQTGFRNPHGRLLSILNTKFDEGVLKTLVQFYDPCYHCFTFPDYQLVPTLEEYSYLMDRPVLEEVTFSGLKETLNASTIAKALDLKRNHEFLLGE